MKDWSFKRQCHKISLSPPPSLSLSLSLSRTFSIFYSLSPPDFFYPPSSGTLPASWPTERWCASTLVQPCYVVLGWALPILITHVCGSRDHSLLKMLNSLAGMGSQTDVCNVNIHINLRYETLSNFKEMYLDSYSRRSECVMARIVNTILNRDPNLPNMNCFQWTRQSIFTPWVEALDWHMSLNEKKYYLSRDIVAQAQT